MVDTAARTAEELAPIRHSVRLERLGNFVTIMYSLRNPLSQRHLDFPKCLLHVARFGTSEISVQARFRVRTFFRCAQVKNFFGLECRVSMVVVQPQDLSNWHAKGLKKYLLPQQALFCGNAGHTVW